MLNAAPNGQGMFRLVETNDFKQLPHITLLFRPGNDAAVGGGGGQGVRIVDSCCWKPRVPAMPLPIWLQHWNAGAEGGRPVGVSVACRR